MNNNPVVCGSVVLSEARIIKDPEEDGEVSRCNIRKNERTSIRFSDVRWWIVGGGS